MTLRLVGQAVVTFAVTNVDDLVLLAVWFGRTAAVRVVLGQYLGFAAILALSVLGALGADLLPPRVLPYLGLVPLLLGVRAAWRAWRERDAVDDGPAPGGTLAVAGVTLANGGDNLGVYVPLLATTDVAGRVGYGAVFLVLVAVWCLAGRFLATRAPVARALARWGHVVLPVVLIAIGLVILLG